MSVSTMNIDKVKGHLVRWQYAIFLQENDERHLTDILRDLSTEADGAVFKGNYHSVNELREQLYDVRLQVYISSVVIQEAISHLRVLDPLLGVQFSATLDVKIKLVMNLLHYEIDSYPLVTNTALLSANHVFMNKWLMHKYSQEFEILLILEPPLLDLASMDLSTTKTHIHRYIAQIRFREQNETLLINILQTIDIGMNPITDVYAVNHMILPYELRRTVYRYCVGVRDLVEALQVLDAELAEDYKHAPDQRVNCVMDQLNLEKALCLATGQSARTNDEPALINRWLMQNYTQKFPNFASGIGRSCSSAFAQSI
ncbi:hypothetical protein BGX23_007752 [Mortierella sp. AD031]|nr:hypothetical protein BGX23_007752 [Mortierella sp. AD031]